MDIREQKNLARKDLLAKRKAIAPEERERRSVAACAKLAECAADVFAKQGVVGVYYAIGSEVQLDSLIRAAYAAGCSVAFPFMVATGEELAVLQMYAVSERAYCEQGSALLGSVQRPFDPEVLQQLAQSGALSAQPVAVGFQVVPMVGFDANGTRMGYGKGCYDRYFETLAGLPELVGVAFAEQECPNLPAEPHDVVLSQIVIA